MQTFKIRVACELNGSKHNAMFLFKPPPGSVDEVVSEAQRFYGEEAASRGGEGFHIASLQVYDAVNSRWTDVTDASQLSDGCQLFAFQQTGSATPPPTQPAPPRTDVTPATITSTEASAFTTLDIKADGVLTLDEMIEAFRKLGLRFTPNQVQDLFIVADADRDGVVTPAEFSQFAAKFPTVIESIHQKKADVEVERREEAVLKQAEAQLRAQQNEEQRLLNSAAEASRKVRDLMGQIADHKLNHEVQLQRKPGVDAQQLQLIEQELALAAQKERLRQVQHDIRKDIEDQLNAVSHSLGAEHVSHPVHTPQNLHNLQNIQNADPSIRSVSENSSSFFLPSEPPQNEIQIGSEVEACNFEMKPEFNGLRGKVAGWRDGRYTVEFAMRGGQTLEMLASNIRAVPTSTDPPLGADIEATGPATTASGVIDVRGMKGRVVGFRSGVLLCEFPPRAGVFEVKPQHIQQSMTQRTMSIQEAVQNEIAQMASESGTSELEKAKKEAALLRQELEAERAANRGNVNNKNDHSPQGRGPASPEAVAAMSRLGGITLHSPTGPVVPSVVPVSPLTAYPPPPMFQGAYGGIDGGVGGVPDFNSLLPTTQEILRKVSSPTPPALPTAAGLPLSYALGPIDPSVL